MAMHKAVLPNKPFFKFKTTEKEYSVKENETYLDLLFFLGYFNLLYYFRHHEPNHPLLKPIESETVYTSFIGSEETYKAERKDTLILSLDREFDWSTGEPFFKKVVVENTFLLQYLLEEYGERSLYCSLSMRSRRQSYYDTSVIPQEFSSVLKALNIKNKSNSSRPLIDGRFGRFNFSKGTRTKTMNVPGCTKHIKEFSLFEALSLIMPRLPFVCLSDVEDFVSDPRYIQVSFYKSIRKRFYKNTLLLETERLDNVLAFLKQVKEEREEEYVSIAISKEVKAVLDKKMTNKDKVFVSSFVDNEIYSIRFLSLTQCEGFSSTYYSYSRKTYDRDEIISFYHLGLLGQLFSLFYKNEKMMHGNACHSRSYLSLSIHHLLDQHVTFKKEERLLIESGLDILPIMSESLKKKPIQLSMFELEGCSPDL